LASFDWKGGFQLDTARDNKKSTYWESPIGSQSCAEYRQSKEPISNDRRC
jgi:predicted MarR family transcription regulator